MSSKDESLAFIGGFVIGGLVGAAVALILAPQSGAETRAQIREKGIELKDRAEDITEDTRRRVEEVSAETKKRTEDLRTSFQKALDETKKELVSRIESLQKGKGAVPAEVEVEAETEA
jgi:gas vesicle protein